MEIHNLISSENLHWLQEQLQNNPPWWMVALVALVPICVLLFVRELCCWFWKINQLLTSLRRMEYYLSQQYEFLEEQKRILQAKREQIRRAAPEPTPVPREEKRRRAAG